MAMKRILFVFTLIFTLALSVNATTWFPAKHTCPMCKHQSQYQEIGSYGGYIYQWPSKFQYVFWPLTDSQSVYSCPECHFSSYMWDFDSVPENKTEAIKAYLATVKFDKEFKNYVDIPMSARLEIAEKVYKLIGEDTEFWCKFYRVIGFHYDQEKNGVKARESRLASLEFARQMLTDPLYAGQEKENLLVIAAMHNYTGRKDSAMVYLDKAELLTYQNKKMKEENMKGLDEYLTSLIKQYKELIVTGTESSLSR